MNTYNFGVYRLQSSVGLACLPLAKSAGQPDVCVVVRRTLDRLPFIGGSSHSWRNRNGDVSLVLQRSAGAWTLRVPNLAEFVIDRSRRRIEIDRVSGLRDEELEHLLIDQVLPRVFKHTGEIVLHAAAVDIAGHVALFAGETGVGKSTLCAALDRLGHKVLTDDCVFLRSVGTTASAMPTYSSLRVRPDTLGSFFAERGDRDSLSGYGEKRRLPLPARSELHHWREVAALYILNGRDHSRTHHAITRQGYGRACIDVLANTFRLDPPDPAGGAELFATATDLVRRLPVFALEVPGTLAALRKDSSQMSRRFVKIHRQFTVVTTSADGPLHAAL